MDHIDFFHVLIPACSIIWTQERRDTEQCRNVKENNQHTKDYRVADFFATNFTVKQL